MTKWIVARFITAMIPARMIGRHPRMAEVLSVAGWSSRRRHRISSAMARLAAALPVSA